MLIGIDVGTTSVKAALIDYSGEIIRQFGSSYKTDRPRSGHVEQSPQDWMDLVLRALAILSDGYKIDAIGLCSQVNTHIFVDAKGAAMLPAITWQDVRCAGDASAIDCRIDMADKIVWWGAPLPVDASHVLARMAYVARTHPEIWSRTHQVLAPKDYCILHLTGECMADPMTNFGILDQSLALIEPLLALVPGARERLPEINGFTTCVGQVKAGLPCAGVPVVTGAMDAWSGLFGAGAISNGAGLYLSGTSEVLGIVSPQRHPTPGVIAFAPCEGITLHAGPTQSGGASAQWIAKLLNRDVADLSSLAERADLRHVPVFLPHLDGERAPIWDSEAKGSFTGLRSETGAAELVRSVFEGVAYSAQLVFESLAQSAGCEAAMIHHSGGGSRSDIWAQIRCDVINCNFKRTATADAGLLGAALFAGVGAGLFKSLDQAASEIVKYDRLFTPDPKTRDRHEERFAIFKLAYDQLKPVNTIL